MPLKVVPLSASVPPNITLEQTPFMKCTTCSPRYYLLLKKRKRKESGSDSDIDPVEAQKSSLNKKDSLGLGKRKGRGGFIK